METKFWIFLQMFRSLKLALWSLVVLGSYPLCPFDNPQPSDYYRFPYICLFIKHPEFSMQMTLVFILEQFINFWQYQIYKKKIPRSYSSSL